MCANKTGGIWPAVLIAAVSVSCSATETQTTEAPAIGQEKGTQQVLELPIRVVDKDGKPVANAKVTPWALRSSQGHGWWRKDDKLIQVDPMAVRTSEDGTAAVPYPRYRIHQELVRTIAVSLSVDHPSYAYTDDLHIDVPLEKSGPSEITLTAGVPLEIRPLVDGKAANLDDVFALWSDGRSWLPGAGPEKLANGSLRIPAMLPGENSVLLVKLDGDRATHFSKIEDFKVAEAQRNKLDIALHPSVRIQGVLSDNVPRPVRNGRIKANTLEPAEANSDRVSWFTWVPIQADGTFVIDGWPAGESLQLIALCEGFIATSGQAPPEVKKPRDPSNDPFSRPQVFRPGDGKQIEVSMTALARCVATAVDEDDKPLAGVTITSWPNVGWWNSGSQVYCYPLVRGERLLRERHYHSAVDEAFPQPFQSVTNAEGKVTLELPEGKKRLAVSSKVYELPVFLGHRDVQVTLTRGETTEVALSLQPRGTEKLGEWDKLAGVVFGCSTREGRRICALPGVQKQMDEFAQRFREGKNQRDPQLLFEAYSAVADAFVDVGDVAEAEKWRQKAVEQAATAKARR
jgi:hypothetical protein